MVPKIYIEPKQQKKGKKRKNREKAREERTDSKTAPEAGQCAEEMYDVVMVVMMWPARHVRQSKPAGCRVR